MAPWSTTTGAPSPTTVQAISMSPTETVLLVSRMAHSSVGDHDQVRGATVDLALGFKVKLDVEPGYRVYREGVRISEFADQAGVPVSTVRYYERIGLLGAPTRTGSGYRDYDDESATRLLFVSRARR